MFRVLSPNRPHEYLGPSTGVCFLMAQKTRMAASYLGTWILLMVLLIYGPVLIGALSNSSTAVQVEGINYFADTLLFGGVILTVAAATRPAD